jgi:hypothetical protein
VQERYVKSGALSALIGARLKDGSLRLTRKLSPGGSPKPSSTAAGSWNPLPALLLHADLTRRRSFGPIIVLAAAVACFSLT